MQNFVPVIRGISKRIVLSVGKEIGKMLLGKIKQPAPARRKEISRLAARVYDQHMLDGFWLRTGRARLPLGSYFAG